METNLTNFAQHYADAWSSHDPETVASFYAENGSLSVNGGSPAIGRKAIAEVAQGFMQDFPDMVVRLDKLERTPDGTKFHWTLIGTNTGPGGTGNQIRISGYELWRLGEGGLIAESKGHFDAADYEHQLKYSSR